MSDGPALVAGPLDTRLREAVAAISSRVSARPRVGIVLGSGLGSLAERIEDARAIPFAAIPHHPRATVAGHVGRWLFGRLEGLPVAAMQGRVHWYEGHPAAAIGFPIRLLRRLGASVLVLTNASGGLNPDFRAGDLMLLRDHLYLAGIAGAGPLVGRHEPSMGERFVDLTQAYDPALRELALRVAGDLGEPLREGIYAMVAGPHYETPAERRFLAALGADAVGMSTAPEVVVARQVGLRVLALSVVTNAATGREDEPETSHPDVLAAGEAATPRVEALVRGVLRALGPELAR